nr:probable inactive ATP-dependent zinc metalloprotease FTSHI 4, chloroplastic [Ipomoea batatas]
MEDLNEDERKEVVFRRHIVDRMPVDCWNDVWRKLHQQLVNVDVYNVKTVPFEDLEHAARVIEEEMFGVDNFCWISANATLEASRLAEVLILQTGMTALGKAYYRYQRDLVPNLAAKVEVLRDEYIRFAVEKCTSILKENQAAVEAITDVLLEKGEIKADEIWSIYKNYPRVPQPTVRPIDEYGALIYAGRWGIHGASLPGRVTFAPGNVGFSTFGASRPMETQIISDETWKLVDEVWDKRVEEIKAEASLEVEE